MGRIWIAWALVAAIGGTAAAARDDAAAGWRERRADRLEATSGSARTPGTIAIAYGSDPLQTLDFWPAKLPDIGGRPRVAPLVVYVHGGGWKRGSKDSATGPQAVDHFTGEGYGFASINYRLVPAVTVEQQAQDVAESLAALLRRRSELGIAPGKVVLMGHSAGAHLVALVGTDPRYLTNAGLSFRDLSGVIANDGAAYDVPTQMADGPPIMKKTYAQAFGEDPARQRALSPTLQAQAPNAPAFLLLHVQREDGIRQAEALEAALKVNATAVERRGFEGQGLRGHRQINRSLGDPAYPATAVVDAWLAQRFR